MKPIYLDYNATTPIDPRVAEAMLPFMYEHFGNPSSSHIYGKNTQHAISDARCKIAHLLHAHPDEIVFTSGGTESNNYALKGAAFALRAKGDHIITSAVEHPAVTEVCEYLKQFGFRITTLPVDIYGTVDIDSLKTAITDRTILISIMHANNEVGTIQPITQIAEIAHQHGALLHSDCAQSVGKIPVRVDELGVDLLSIAGHKLYAPKGVGALYIRNGVILEKFMHGAGHEKNRRAGTENVIFIAGLGKACEIIEKELSTHTTHLTHLRDQLEQTLIRQIPDCRVNGHPTERLPNTTNISFKAKRASDLLSQMHGIAASPGAACHSDSVAISSVLQAMNVPLEYAMGTIRFSVGRYTTVAEIDTASREIIRTLLGNQSMSATHSCQCP